MRTLVLSLGLLGVALISGCSSTHTVQAPTKLVVDQEYVAAVEAASKRSTTQNRIIWVNPPMEYVADDGAKEPQH
ncbi:hypothetical protein [Pseudidiomarina homiensis]|uniref:Lipoprotein n=1 Tax=Pseudidiomarina homiensis TaxID=364198 RepID=A0A432XUE0_9GAMM|nr:hypothetical protein [Pseudidiomarina homiensis]RUO52356.1 hypothetical protein CWI70_11560 [Pseudidiomarina homiensis]